MRDADFDKVLDFVLGWIGIPGSGKTYAAGRSAERLLAQKHRAIICDPLGAWWGLRLMADGVTRSPYNVVIFGGEHADLALTENAGALIGETAGTMAESCIIDLSQLGTKAAERRFMLAFLTALYRHANREPVHLILDEADMFAPQKILDKEGGAAQLLGQVETIVRRGRLRGFIPWLISQRPAVLNKDVLSMVRGLAAFQLVSSQDRNALWPWIEGQADKETGKKILANLPTLKPGEGLLWLPQIPLLEQVKFPPKLTFDSSRTPTRGERIVPRVLAPLDVGALRDKLAKVEGEAKNTNPALLRARVAELERQLKATPTAAAAPTGNEIREAEQRGYDRGKVAAEVGLAKRTKSDRLARIKMMNGILDGMDKAQAALKRMAEKETDDAKADPVATDIPLVQVNTPLGTKLSFDPVPGAKGYEVRKLAGTTDAQGGDISPGERSILVAAAQHGGISPEHLSIVTGYKKSSRDTYIARAIQRGLVFRDNGQVYASDEGARLIGDDYERIPSTPAELREYWQRKLPDGEGKLLAILIGEGGTAERDRLGDLSGYKKSSRDTYLSRLITRTLIRATRPGVVTLSDLLA